MHVCGHQIAGWSVLIVERGDRLKACKVSDKDFMNWCSCWSYTPIVEPQFLLCFVSRTLYLSIMNYSRTLRPMWLVLFLLICQLWIIPEPWDLYGLYYSYGQGGDSPEVAVAKLFAFAKRNSTQFGDYGAQRQCLQLLPPAGQAQVFEILRSVAFYFLGQLIIFMIHLLFLQAAALEVENLLVSGKKKEALQSAQDGQLWGPALVLASQLGDEVLLAAFFTSILLCNLIRSCALLMFFYGICLFLIAVLCRYSKENGPSPVGSRITVADLMSANCRATCWCFFSRHHHCC